MVCVKPPWEDSFAYAFFGAFYRKEFKCTLNQEIDQTAAYDQPAMRWWWSVGWRRGGVVCVFVCFGCVRFLLVCCAGGGACPRGFGSVVLCVFGAVVFWRRLLFGVPCCPF